MKWPKSKQSKQYGPLASKLQALMTSIPVSDVAVAGGEVQYRHLWPEALKREEGTVGGNAKSWKEMWECSNND